MTWLRLFESIHGHLGVLAAAALLHPALLLRKGKPLSRRNRWSLGLSAGFTLAAFGAGLWIYEDYRSTVKKPLFAQAPEVGALFETKEHLAVGVLALVLGGLICALAAPRSDAWLRQLAARLFAAATLLCVVVVVLGTYVAAVRGFPM